MDAQVTRARGLRWSAAGAVPSALLCNQAQYARPQLRERGAAVELMGRYPARFSANMRIQHAMQAACSTRSASSSHSHCSARATPAHSACGGAQGKLAEFGGREDLSPQVTAAMVTAIEQRRVVHLAAVLELDDVRAAACQCPPSRSVVLMVEPVFEEPAAEAPPSELRVTLKEQAKNLKSTPQQGLDIINVLGQ